MPEATESTSTAKNKQKRGDILKSLPNGDVHYSEGCTMNVEGNATKESMFKMGIGGFSSKCEMMQ